MSLKILKFLNYLGAIVLYIIIISVGKYLITSKIIEFKYEFFQYPYYLGLGVISWFPTNYMITYFKKQ
jgi:hypothetical protein